MTHQERTWHETNTAEGKKQWNIAINDSFVPGGYVLQTGESIFETYYPKMKRKVFSNLDEAKKSLELAPPVTKGQIPIGKHREDPQDEYLTAEVAGELLGVSRYRINAMVVNGVIAGKRHEDQILISRKSVEERMDKEGTGPAGRFAHMFICYYPENDNGSYFIFEFDHEDEDQMEEARAFLAAAKAKEIKGKTYSLDYGQAMRLYSRAKRDAQIDNGSQTTQVEAELLTFEKYLEMRDDWTSPVPY